MIQKTEAISNKKTNQQKKVKQKNKKIKYSSEYIAYIENGESGAVFIARDIADKIDTTGKWVDVVELEYDKRNDAKKDYKYFVVELFNRREQPKYEKHMTLDEKKFLTWQVASADIAKQRSNGVAGSKFLVLPRLVNYNKGRWTTVKYAYNKTFARRVPDNCFNSSCEWRKTKKYIPPIKDDWKYEIIATIKLNNKQLKYIRLNAFDINQKIHKNKSAKIEYFNLSDYK